MFSAFGESSSSFPLSYYNSLSLTTQERNHTSSQQNNQQNLFQGPYNYMPPLVNNPIYENGIDTNFIPLHSTSKLMLGDPIGLDQMRLNCPFDIINHSNTNKKTSAKKDRHTKICTAQGIRDRRVRLSINIAREFFNLQDMLGFDKASKTLGWLLVKSKDAIDELEINLKNNNGTSKCSLSADQNTIEEEDQNQILSGKRAKEMRARKGEHDKKPCNSKIIDAREIRRAKARERARERTKNKKMMIINNLSSPHPHDHHKHNFVLCQSRSSYYGHNTTISVAKSVVIKSKKLKESSHNPNHEMNFKHNQEGCSYYKDQLTKFALEKELGCPYSNITNSSKGFHIIAKPWDTPNNQMLN